MSKLGCDKSNFALHSHFFPPILFSNKNFVFFIVSLISWHILSIEYVSINVSITIGSYLIQNRKGWDIFRYRIVGIRWTCSKLVHLSSHIFHRRNRLWERQKIKTIKNLFFIHFSTDKYSHSLHFSPTRNKFFFCIYFIFTSYEVNSFFHFYSICKFVHKHSSTHPHSSSHTSVPFTTTLRSTAASPLDEYFER